ncbi:MAG TPA: response regulator transcription factor [Terrimesophilobacter sp.]|nr:response regulator transcription factor [Terrimesophilobacter sp.]
MGTVIRVLVADDHPVVRGGVVGLLSEESDIKVVAVATDGREAVEAAHEHRPDLVLMDLRMPGVDGVAATEQIRAIDPAIRVLVFTTYETDENILGAIEAGASGYLLKASPAEEVLAGVRAVAAGETVLGPSIAARLVSRVRQPQTPTLSVRQLEVLRLVAEGRSNPEIAAELFIGESTVKTHLGAIFERLEVSDRTRAVTRAMELGLLSK